MKLLFDQNISFQVPRKMRTIFPDSKHVSDLKLVGYSDIEIWEFAKVNDYSIVTFDFDFIDIATLKGFPPKIIWLRTGNTSTDNLIAKILTDSAQIKDFLMNKEMAFLEIK